MGPRRALDLLLQELEDSVDEILAAARAASATPDRWRRTVEKWTGSAPQHGVGQAGAANGADVFETLRALEGLFERKLDHLERSLDEVASDSFEDTFDKVRHQSIRDLCKRRTTAYNQSLATPPNLGGVFARAAARQQQTPAAAQGSVRTMMFCRTCAAPRESGDLYGNCSFCGNPLFPGGDG